MLKRVQVAFRRWGAAVLLCSSLSVAPNTAGTPDDSESKAPVPPDIKIEPVRPGQRLNVAVALGKPESSRENRIPVFVKVRLSAGHHIYALDESGSSNQPTRLSAKLPSGLSLAGRWHGPEAKKLSNGSRVYEDEVVFWNILEVEANAPAASSKIQITISFQVCNEMLCWPPEMISREIALGNREARK